MIRRFAHLAILLTIISPSALFAASNDTTTVNYEVQAINEFSISGNPAPMVISALQGEAGTELAYVTDETTTYSITTNQTSRKITVGLNTAMPTATELFLTMAPAEGWTNNPLYPMLSDTAVTLVSGGPAVGTDLMLAWQFVAHVDRAGIVASQQKTVTFTLQAE